MKETGFLRVIPDRSFSEKVIVINPNDGFDLGLMMTEATVEMLYGESLNEIEKEHENSLHARIYQKNECKLGTVELSLKTAEKLGGPKQVRLHMQEGEQFPKLYITMD